MTRVHNRGRDGTTKSEYRQKILELQANLASANDGVEHGNEVIEDLIGGNKKLQAEIEKLKEALEHIIEYWNRSASRGAISDALDEILETAKQALKEKQ